jgi:diguanylate cyclase (GGDEF)-like protein/PAS domain S-box-containing protein
MRQFWNRLTFASRLLTTTGLALLVSAIVMLAVSAKQEAVEIQEDIESLLAKEIETLPAALSEMIVLGDYASLQQTLDRYVLRPLISEVSYRDAFSNTLSSRDEASYPNVPAWYIALFSFQDFHHTADVNIGGRKYGELRLTASSNRLVERAWKRLTNHFSILSLAVLIDLISILLILRFGLAPLKKLEDSVNLLSLGEDNHFIPSGSPEIIQLGQAFKEMAENISSSQHELQRILEQLKLEINFSNGVLDTAKSLIMVIDLQGKVVRINRAAEEFTGYSFHEMKDIPFFWIRFLLPEQRPHVEAVFQKSVSGNIVVRYENFWMRRDGSRCLFDWSNALLRDEAGQVQYLVTVGIDITERHEYEQDLKLSASVFLHAREGILITDSNGIILDVNKMFTVITGYEREEAINQRPSLLKSGLHDQTFYQKMWDEMLTHGYWSGEITNRRKSGELYTELLTISAVHEKSGEVKNFVALFSDISALKSYQNQLELLAHYDPLTNLPNRVLFADRLSQSIAWCQRNQRSTAVVYIDLDGFKTVNDNHGHKVGDELLIIVSQRMKASLRTEDTLARIGGDEFVAVLVDVDADKNIHDLLTRLLLSASEPIIVNDLVLSVSASIGVSIYPQDGVEADQLMRYADQAMYQAKVSGKNRYHLFDIAKDNAVKSHLESLERIQQAFNNKEFVVYYQPKINMKTGEVFGAEALIRWQHPEQGLLSPAVFLPIIENHPFIVELSEWILNTVMMQIAQWQKEGVYLTVSVNIASFHLQQNNFVDRIRDILQQHAAIEPKYLEIEILETSSLDDIAGVSAKIQTSTELGISFALDDFGTGYSSLSYLKRLPADTLKIDQSFIRDMLDDEDDLAIVKTIINLGKIFRRKIIAEGVENVLHGQILVGLGCDLAQGYAVARPMPAIEILSWIEKWQSEKSWLAFNIEADLIILDDNPHEALA